MKIKMLLTLCRTGTVLYVLLFIPFNIYSQSCHGSESSSSSQNHGSDKSVVNSTNYKKSTKKIYYVCKMHSNIKHDSKGICSICNRKLKKKFEYLYD